MSLELGALLESTGMLAIEAVSEAEIRAGLFLHLFRRLVGRAYKLPAPSYEEAGTRVPTTDYRPPTTKPPPFLSPFSLHRQSPGDCPGLFVQKKKSDSLSRTALSIYAVAIHSEYVYRILLGRLSVKGDF